MFLLTVSLRLKSFSWYFLMFANKLIYLKVELLQHVNMKHSNKFYRCGNFFFFFILSAGNSLNYISTQPFSTPCKHQHKIIVREIDNLWPIHHVWNTMSKNSQQDWEGVCGNRLAYLCHLFANRSSWDWQFNYLSKL